jgi:serine protease Do
MTRSRWNLAAAAMLACVAASPAFAAVDMDAQAKTAAKSLVIVDYTLRNENSSAENSGQGIVLSKDGVILIAGRLISENLPKEWITEIKVRVPGKNFESVPAKLLGRTRNRLFAYLKTEAPIDATPFSMGDTKELSLGQEVFGVAISKSASGYTTYIGKSDLRAIVELTHTIGNTASFGLTRGNSPVYDAATGAFVGLTIPAVGESMMISDGNGAGSRIELLDDEQSSVFLPVTEVKDAVTNIPTEPFEIRRSWLAVDEVTGLDEDIRSLKKITQPSGVMIGSVISGEAADKAGLKAKDIILTVDGKEFSHNPVPDMMVMHFNRILEDKKPGDKVVLGILRDGAKTDLSVTLGESPKMAQDMPLTFSGRVGVVTRDLVFYDTYVRHLPQDTKGVYVTLVKQGSPAYTSQTPLRERLIITKVDDQPVENQKQFLDIMKQQEAKADLKEMVFVAIAPNGQTGVYRVDLSK